MENQFTQDTPLTELEQLRMKVTLTSRAHPEYGEVTIPFPIPDEDYDHTMELLRGLDIGDTLAQDCQIVRVESEYPVLTQLEGTMVNVDELDYLARRMNCLYTILLNVLPVPLIPGEKRDPIPVELPASSEQLQATLEKAGCASWSNVMTAILDSPLPAWNRRIFMDDEVPQVIQLAEKLRQLDADGKLTKYKAILSATDCQEVADAVALSKTVDEYMLLPEVRTLEEAAVDDLRISIDPITMGRLQPYIDLRGYGVAMLEYHNAKLTSYGRLDRDGEPIQLVRDEPRQGGMEMMQ